jgi:tetratricopeptide (TPR) repeat protein
VKKLAAFEPWALLAITAGLSLLLPLLITPGLHRGYNLPRYGLLITTAPLVLGLLLDLALFRSFPRIGLAFPALLLLEVAALALPSFTIAPDLKQAIFGSFERQMGLLTYLALALLALGARAAVQGSERRFRWLLGAMAGAGVLTFLEGPQKPVEVWRWTGAFGHANYTASVLLIPFLAASGLALGARGAARRIGWWAAAGLALLELILLQTRGAWLGALGGAAILVLLLFFGPLSLEGRAARRLRITALLLGSALAAAALLVLAVPRWREAALAKTRTGLRLEGGSSGRLEGWRDSIGFFRDHGLLGVGAESFRDAFLPFKSEALGQVLRDQQLRDLHSMPLHLLAEGGVGALAAHLGLTALALLALASTIRDPALPRGSRWAAAGLFAGIAAHFLDDLTICHTLSDSIYWHLALGLGAGAGAGWAREVAAPAEGAAAARSEAQARRRLRRHAFSGAGEAGSRGSAAGLPAPVSLRLLAASAAGALLVLSLLNLQWLFRADAAILRCMSRAELSVKAGSPDLKGVVGFGEEAIEAAPGIGPYHSLYSKALERFLSGPERDEALTLAIREAREAARLGGNKESYPLELGYLLYLAGRLEPAEAQIRASIAADRHFYGSRLWLARVLLAEGKRSEARSELDRATRLAPGHPEVEKLEAEMREKGPARAIE